MEFLQSDLCAEGEAGLLGFQVSLTWVSPTESTVKTQVKTCLQVPWLEQSYGGKRGRKERREVREGRKEGDGRRRSHGVLAVLRVSPPASCSTKFAGNSTAHRRPRARWGGAGRGGAGGWRGGARLSSLYWEICLCTVAAACAYQSKEETQASRYRL